MHAHIINPNMIPQTKKTRTKLTSVLPVNSAQIRAIFKQISVSHPQEFDKSLTHLAG